MKKSFSLLILHKIGKILIALKLYDMNLIRRFNRIFDIRLFMRSHSEKKPAVVPANGRNGDRLKLIEDGLLPFDNIYELSNKDHQLQLVTRVHPKVKVLS